jgi:hypothetical protein
MTERIIPERRADNRSVLIEMQRKIHAVHDRVYDGLGKELRQEVKKETDKLSNRLWAVIMVIVIALAGIVIEGRVSANQNSAESERNYKAIIELGSKLEIHEMTTVPGLRP